MKRTRIGLFGIFGIRNIGNECTLQAMLHNVRVRLPDADIFSICYVPEDTAQRYALQAVPVSAAYTRQAGSSGATRRRSRAARLFRGLFRRLPAEFADWFRVFKILRGTDMLAMTGTGMLTDYNTSWSGYPYDIFKWTLAAKMAGCRVLFVGVGVGPIHERLSRILIRHALILAGYRSYRDTMSKARLEQLGLDTSEDQVFPDLAFSLPESSLPASRARQDRKRIVGLGVMEHVDIHRGGQPVRERLHDAYLTKMCDFAEWLLERGYGIRILQGDMDYDRAVRRNLRTKLEGRGINYSDAGIVDDDVATVGDLLDQLAGVDVVVSPRFHNLILGLMLNKPIISLSYDPKSDALLESIGLGDYCQNIDDVELDLLISQFNDLEARSEELKTMIFQRVGAYRDRLKQQYQLILGGI